MKVLLLIPPFDISASWGAKKRMKEGILPPLGVGYLAAMLESRGHAVELVDAPSLFLGAEEVADRIVAATPGVVGISCLTVRAGAAYELAAAIKSRLPELTVAMGGPHVTAFYEHIFEECPHVDVLFPGEAENSFANYLDALESGHNPEGVRGIVYRDSQGVRVETPAEPLVKNLDLLPFPSRHLYPNDIYRPLPTQGRRHPSTIMMTSRGCPWSKCLFCYQGARYGHPYRRRSPENCIEEVRELVKGLGFREIMFWDDNFCVNEKWVTRFCDLLDSEHLDITWTVEGHVRTVTETMLTRMAASGCYNIFYGLETGTQEILNLIDKGFTLGQAREAVQWAKSAGMEIRASYILGFPTETPEMADETIRFACELNTDFANFVPYHVWPGTPLEKFALENGRNITWDSNLIKPSYVPDSFGEPALLEDKINQAYRRFYGRPSYLLATLWRMRHPAFFYRAVAGARYWLSLWGGG